MDEYDKDHGTGTPVMDPAQNPAHGHFVHDEIDGGVRLLRRRVIIKSQDYSGDRLNGKKQSAVRYEI